MAGTQLHSEDLEVLYEDNHLIAVYKPAGVLVQEDRTGDRTLVDTVKAWLKLRYDKPGNVYLAVLHRLDRPVAGVVLFAKTSKAAGRVAADFRERRIYKVYRAVVDHAPSPAQARVEHHLLRDKDRRRTEVVPAETPGAKAAMLSYRTVERDGDTALVEIHPQTGRPHQIRVQMAAIGSPLRGDTKYGGKGSARDGRVALYSCEITFKHPTRGEELTIRTHAPAGWPWQTAR